jgi:outer membrane protein assembly factor BamD (BamD/ComL family)
MKKFLLVSALVCVLIYGAISSAVALWAKRKEPGDLSGFRAEQAKLKGEVANMQPQVAQQKRLTSRIQQAFFDHAKPDQGSGSSDPGENIVQEFERIIKTEQCLNETFQALASSSFWDDADRRVEELKQSLDEKGMTDEAKNLLKLYIDERKKAELKAREATIAFSQAANSIGYADCIKRCDDFLWQRYAFPFIKLRNQITTLRNKATEKFDWFTIVESEAKETEEQILERIKQFIEKYPGSEHLADAKAKQRSLQANIDWRTLMHIGKDDRKFEILQFHKFVENYPEDPRSRQALVESTKLLEELFSEKLKPKDTLEMYRYVSRRNHEVVVGEQLESDDVKIKLTSYGKPMILLRRGLAEEPDLTPEEKRKRKFNEALAVTKLTLKTWDASALDSLAQTCRTLGFVEEEVCATNLADIVRACRRFKELAGANNNQP